MPNRFDDQIDLARFAAGSLVRECDAPGATDGSRAAAVQHLEMTLEELAIASEELELRLVRLDEVTAEADRERSRYERLFAESPVAAVVTDRVGIIHEINDRALEMFDTTVERASGRPLSTFIDRGSRRDFRNRLGLVGRGDPRQAWELSIRRSRLGGGSVVGCELDRTADLRSDAPGFRWTFTEIVGAPAEVGGDAVARATDLQDRVDELEVDLAFHRVTSAAMAHDLRAPLGVIAGLSRTPSSRVVSEADRAKTSEAIAWQSARALRLIDDLLDLQQGHLDSDRGEHDDLNDVIELAVLEVGARDHEVIVSGVSDASIDRKVLRRIVANLVGNAVKLAPAGTRIDVRTWKAAGGLLLAVEDRGPGFGRGEGQHLFEPFSRLDRDVELPGWGLGLSIVAELARLHGGAAWAVDRRDGGAAVQVYLKSLPLEDG